MKNMIEKYVWWTITRQNEAGVCMYRTLGYFAAALALVIGMSACENRNETALGTIGAAGVKELGKLYTQAHMDAVDNERAAEALRAVEAETRAVAAAKQLELEREQRERLDKADKLHREEIDRLKSEKETWREQWKNLATTNVSRSCPLGNAEHTRAVWGWLKDRQSMDKT